MTSDSDELSDDIDLGTVKRTDQYEADVIDSIKTQTQKRIPTETPEEIESNIQKIKSKLSEATLNGKDKLIAKYKKELEEENAKLELIKILPKGLEVGLSSTDKDKSAEGETLPEQNDELNRYWHYKVLHTAFAGEDSINLTIDDSDQKTYKFRNDFIRDHCAPYTDLTQIADDIKIPTAIWNSLFSHQKVGVKWLLERWKDGKGGIEGDEMGLGKTAIACVFLHSLIFSKQIDKPVLILCPLTVSQQWIRELHIWVPQSRSILLHATRSNKAVTENDILRSVKDSPDFIVTNYETLYHLKDKNLLNMVEWSVIICDEGHKIRNHNSNITKMVKSLNGGFHLILSGSPIQNSLIEFWSLFDFAVPGLLGTLSVFQKEFAEPIQTGGYGNANPFQVLRGYSLAVALRDFIKPYLLRRLKKDVNANLPGKCEQIFFISLTPQQIECYLDFTNSSYCRKIESGKTDLFEGIAYLRKVCNHPYIADPTKYFDDLSFSSKLNLLRKILPQWNQHKHRVLLFSQSLKMLDFLCLLCDELNLSYFRFDGDTPNQRRIQIMDRFNAGENFACIASTKVGGIGVNLTGADRVIIVDPDWNPSTDNQALERAWRIGQKRDVSVYRLITVGTIEEKIYKKQIYKQFLSENILNNSNKKRLFTPNSIKDLFRLDMEVEKEFQIPANKTSSSSQKIQKAKTHSNDSNSDISDSDESAENEKLISEIEVEDLSGISSDDDDEDFNQEKEMVKNLVTCGDLKHAFPIDELFSEEADNKKITKEKHKIEKEALESLNKLKKSNEDQIKKDSFKIDSEENKLNKETPSEKHKRKIVFNNLVRLFTSNGGVVTSDQVTSYFNKNSLSSELKNLKKSLRKMSVLNKRTHTWHLKTEYKKLFID